MKWVDAKPKPTITTSFAPTRYREVVLTSSKLVCGFVALCFSVFGLFVV